MGTLATILWFIIVILVLGWILGLLFHIAGAFIHILLIVAAIILLYNLFFANKRTY